MSKASRFPLADPAKSNAEKVVAPPRVISAGNKAGLADWQGDNWWTVYAALQSLNWTHEMMARLAMDGIEQALLRGRLPLLKVGGEQRTNAQVVTVVNVGEDDMFPADHYNAKFGLSRDRLRKAREDGRFKEGEYQQRGGRWFYSLAAVRRLFPDARENP